MEDLMPFDLPANRSSIIKVVGVGGGGSNAVNYMFRQGIKDVNFVVCNTDAQALIASPVPSKIQLGESLTEGRGAGNKPDVGREAAIENLDDVVKVLGENTKMVFITAGMGGGTGTGAAPVIAKAAKEMGVLTIAIVTLPFKFEGPRRINQAVDGIMELSKYVDSLLVINNEKLREIHGDLKITEAFGRADNILTIAAKGIAEIITVEGYVNVDFADVQTVMTNSGVALMGAGVAEGENRAMRAIQLALNSPLLNNNDINGARNILLNVTSGSEEVTMDEIGIINDFVQEASGYTADLIWGNSYDPSLGAKISVTVIATGFETDIIPEVLSKRGIQKTVVQLNDTRKEPVVEKVSPPVQPVQDSKYQRVFGLNEQQTEKTHAYNDEKYMSEKELDENARRAVERMQKLKETQQEKAKQPYQLVNTGRTLEELENVPAYKRKNLTVDSANTTNPINGMSRYTLSEENNGIKLSKNNPYLNDNVD